MHKYLIALGSNIRHQNFGAPTQVVRTAAHDLEALGSVLAASKAIDSAPIGPSIRTYANSVLVLETLLEPKPLLAALKRIEARFGVRRGQRWSSRVLDLDIVLWSGDIFADSELQIPHPEFRNRPFVLGPASKIAADWRDPITGLAIKHLNARLTKPHTIPR
ncbi:2-amino-4-hydroxy-6-hydroxymethyldihydropteridine diphosphokinase [Altererythrobacter sp. RZ02]|uniref:2-amino-4-hydroxy-6-hydroxymethyldihydropteridine pyrophosphokinase n=1 Tax=Pontixanthobacter rizhaonensis TaxID=2730337 RepID=A0A848QQP6_9SPHN|nr:2-amino-4-hydroxy-6-hydroxymethyldihydropteridine diphosphokinase [Pontixanthobacter rizhaonensis]NMW33020.1 2-amino-4-hydroxy-6-hydroxymethyldihydropteridine diphosphokinase [Pontixanthobacter rizhaonensis]